MTWFKVDDNLSHHFKVRAAGNAAMGLWVRAGAWSMQHLTDGFIPRGTARDMGSAAECERLVDAGLWTHVTGGYQFHQFNDPDRQRTRAEILAVREAEREKKRRQREKGLATIHRLHEDPLSPRDSRRDSPPIQTRPDQASEIPNG